MKKTTQFLGLIMIGSVLALGSCKKGCTDSEAVNYNEEVKEKRDDGTCAYGPTIVLNGASTVAVALGDTYLDAGATATNQDGSSVDVTADISAVNTAAEGSYVVTYTATNENATVTTTRTVVVSIMQSNYISDWDVTSDCGTTLPLAGTATIMAGATAADLTIDNMFTFVGGTANATISGANITIPSQTISVTGGDIQLSGTGTLNASGTEITINYTYDNMVPIIGGQGSCTATYVKQ